MKIYYNNLGESNESVVSTLRTKKARTSNFNIDARLALLFLSQLPVYYTDDRKELMQLH
jgi:hypothetical protein